MNIDSEHIGTSVLQNDLDTEPPPPYQDHTDCMGQNRLLCFPFGDILSTDHQSEMETPSESDQDDPNTILLNNPYHLQHNQEQYKKKMKNLKDTLPSQAYRILKSEERIFALNRLVNISKVFMARTIIVSALNQMALA